MVNILEDEESMAEFLANAKIQMKDKASFVAVKEKNDRIVAVLIFRVVDRSKFF